ncbi:hypothetical protein [Pseudoalteromonas denitrificans]|uniref:hypothetical protein n=1 Tax=Pseudoalteromonas denitrificans TaxID=43656 RepID=UPI000B894473|nr:hypothetical protein [Pseudoalteromonas denitrificans]
MSNKRISGARFFIAFCSLFGGRIICSLTSIIIVVLLSYNLKENTFVWDFALAWSLPCLMVGLIIDF